MVDLSHSNIALCLKHKIVVLVSVLGCDDVSASVRSSLSHSTKAVKPIGYDVVMIQSYF